MWYSGIVTLILIFGGASALPSQGYSNPPSADYGSTGSTYGGSNNCYEVDEVVQVDRCQTHNVRECMTNHTMSCQQEVIKNCSPITVTEPNKKCFNVTIKSCHYDEKVDHQVIDTYFPKQVCYKDQVPVCNTVYKIVNATATRQVCSTMPKKYCHKENKIVEDKVCKTDVRMDCSYGNSGSYNQGVLGGLESDRDGHGLSGGVGYESASGHSHSGGYDSTSGHSGGGYDSSSSHSCQKKLETKCFTTPRTIQIDTCFTRNEKSCEYIQELVPRITYEDDCRQYEKRYCKMEQRPQKKQIKKYTYQLRCEPKEVWPCLDLPIKKVIPNCEPDYYDKCQVIPHEHCYDVPKEVCYKEPVVVKRQKCDNNSGTDYSGSEY